MFVVIKGWGELLDAVVTKDGDLVVCNATGVDGDDTISSVRVEANTKTLKASYKYKWYDKHSGESVSEQENSLIVEQSENCIYIA